MKPKLIHCLALVLIGGLSGFAKADQTTNGVATKFAKTIIKLGWMPQTNAIVGIPIPASELTVRSAVYSVEYSPTRSNEVTVIAFKNPRSGNIWIGPAMSFYTEADTKIIGGMVYPRVMLWRESLVTNQTNLEAAIAEFDKDEDGSALVASSHIPDSSLDGVLPWSFFTPNGHAQESKGIQPQVKSALTKNGILQIDMENPMTHSTASVWVETKHWKPIKAVENGKKVFPKSWF